jgi:hypothetical protein
MQEVDACVAGAEEVLSSSEVSEAAEKACRRAHPKAAQAPAACRQYVASLSEALRRVPAGNLVDAESICSELVNKQSGVRQGAVASSTIDNIQNSEEKKFVSSCVQFADNLMSSPTVSEAEVRKSCEAHLPNEEKMFCSGYARLVFQKADTNDFANFCIAEYRRMSLTITPPPSHVDAAQLVVQPKKTSSLAISMPAICAKLFDQVASASVSGLELKKEASDLCTQELSRLAPAHRPPTTRIRVGCKFFANRLAKMKEQQGASSTTADAFCAQIATPQHPHTQQTAAPQTPQALPPLPKAPPVEEPAAPVAPTSSLVTAGLPPLPKAPPVEEPAAARSSPIQQHVQQTGPVFVSAASVSAPISNPAPSSPTAPLAPAIPSVTSAPPAPPAKEVQLPVISASAALPALNAAATMVMPQPPGPEEVAKTKSDEDFLSKFLNKYEASVGSAEASATKINTPQPQIKVFRDDEMAEVRRKAEQLFGSDVDTSDGGANSGNAATPQPAVSDVVASSPPVSLDISAQPAAIAVAAMQPAAVPAPPTTKASPSVAQKKPTSMISMDGGSKEGADFLSSFLNTYTSPDDGNKLAAQPAQQQPPATPAATPPAQSAASPLALLAEAPPAPSAGDGGPMDVDSLVTAFLARSGN